jgi:hypothetical protein
VIDLDRVPQAVQALHGAFELEGEDTILVEDAFRAGSAT